MFPCVSFFLFLLATKKPQPWACESAHALFQCVTAAEKREKSTLFFLPPPPSFRPRPPPQQLAHDSRRRPVLGGAAVQAGGLADGEVGVFVAVSGGWWGWGG